MKKLPSITSLKQEWATLNTEKKKLYAGYREQKDNSRALTVALDNANHILGIKPYEQKRETEHTQNKCDTQEI